MHGPLSACFARKIPAGGLASAPLSGSAYSPNTPWPSLLPACSAGCSSPRTAATCAAHGSGAVSASAAMVRRLRYRNGNSRDAAGDVFLRIIKEREAVHPEWRNIHAEIESGPGFVELGRLLLTLIDRKRRLPQLIAAHRGHRDVAIRVRLLQAKPSICSVHRVHVARPSGPSWLHKVPRDRHKT